MEIDPRLRPPTDSAPPSSSTSVSVPQHHSFDARQQPASSYPELTSHIPPSHQTPTESTSPSGLGASHYYGGLSHSPHSYYADTGALSGNDAAATAAAAIHGLDNDPLADLKRPRACEACRQLKVRCEPDNDNSSGSCRRCAKAGRNCVITAPTRKRQKKTDSRVAELEKKIDALTRSLDASNARNSVGGEGIDSSLQQGQYNVHPHDGGDPSARRWMGPSHPSHRPSSHSSGATFAGMKRKHSGEYKVGSIGNDSMLGPLAATPHSPTSQLRAVAHGETTFQGPEEHNAVFTPMEASYDYTDVIDRKIVDVETANKAFTHYVNAKSVLLPFVVFTPHTTMSDVRRMKPMLFLAILTVSVGPFQPTIQTSLLNEAYRVVADRIMVRGEKSLELIQALLVLTGWYTVPDHFEQLKFFQLAHTAAVMGMDLGMGRRTGSKVKQPFFWKEILGKKTMPLDLDAAETRRTWLGCYWLCVNCSMSLRRFPLVRWQPYMDECVQILGTAPDALPSDRIVCHLVKMTQIGEDISFQFSLDDPVANVAITDQKVQYALKGFEKQIEQWRNEIAPENYTSTVQYFEQILNVYLHEIAMHVDHNIEDFQPPFLPETEDSAKADMATPAHVSACTACLESISRALDILQSIDPIEMRDLPTLFMVRTSYALVVLIKIYSAAAAPGSRIGQVFDSAELQVEQRLDRIIQHMKSAGEFNGGRTPQRFSVVLGMLKSWFISRRDGGAPSKEAADSESETKPAQQKRSDMGPTPLHLLSEVAMAPGHRPGSNPTQQQISQQDEHNSRVNHLSSGDGANSSAGESWSQYPNPLPSFTAPYQQHDYAPQFQQQSFDGQQQHNMMGVGGGFVPELGLASGMDATELYSLGTMLDDGLLTFSGW